MNQALFRPEVSKHRRERLLGEVIICQPVAYLLLTLLLATAAAIALGFLLTHSYTRRETVSGYLVPTQGVVAVFPAQPGLLLENYTHEGQQVAQGDPLFRVQLDQKGSGERYLSGEIIEELQAQKSRLTDSIELARQTLDAQLQQHDNSIARLEQEIAALDTLVLTQRRLYELERQSWQRGSTLALQGAIARSDRDSLEKNFLDHEKSLRNVELNRHNKAFELRDATLGREGLLLAHQRELTGIESQLSDINRQLASANAEQASIVRAPIAGTVTSLLPHLGERVDGSRPVLSLVPAAAQLEAHLFIPTRAIGFVQQGQAVKLRYQAFPYQRFGLYDAEILQVSNAVLSQHEVALLPVNEPVYKAVAALEHQAVTAYGVEVALKPGILLSADIALDRRSLLEWLLDPLYSLRGTL